MFRRVITCSSRQHVMSFGAKYNPVSLTRANPNKPYKQLHTLVNNGKRKTISNYHHHQYYHHRRNEMNIGNRRNLSGGEVEPKSPYPSQAYAFGREVEYLFTIE